MNDYVDFTSMCSGLTDPKVMNLNLIKQVDKAQFLPFFQTTIVRIYTLYSLYIKIVKFRKSANAHSLQHFELKKIPEAEFRKVPKNLDMRPFGRGHI